MLMFGSVKFRQVCNPQFPACAQHPDSQKARRKWGTKYYEDDRSAAVSAASGQLASYAVSQTTGSLIILDILTSGLFFCKHMLGFVYHSFFCQSLMVMAIILSLLYCHRLLCACYYIAWYWNQSAFPFKVLSCHPSAIICFHPLKLPYNGNHAMRTKARAERKKGGKLKWGSSSSCSESNFVLSGSFRVSTWTWTRNVRALHVLPPLLTQLIFPVQILEGSSGWLLLHQGQQVVTLFLERKPVSLCLLTAAGKREGCGRESLLLQQYWWPAALFKIRIQLAGHPENQQLLGSCWRRPPDQLHRNPVCCIQTKTQHPRFSELPRKSGVLRL